MAPIPSQKPNLKAGKVRSAVVAVVAPTAKVVKVAIRAVAEALPGALTLSDAGLVVNPAAANHKVALHSS